MELFQAQSVFDSGTDALVVVVVAVVVDAEVVVEPARRSRVLAAGLQRLRSTLGRWVVRISVVEGVLQLGKSWMLGKGRIYPRGDTPCLGIRPGISMKPWPRGAGRKIHN